MLSHKVFLDIFSGTAPIAHHLKLMGYAVLTFDVDKGPLYDVSRPAVARVIEGWIKSGEIWGYGWPHLVPPCPALAELAMLPAVCQPPSEVLTYLGASQIYPPLS